VAPDVDPTPARGVWVKHSPGGLPALPSRIDPPDNRWQRGAVVDAIYLANDEDTAWAEWYRHLAENGIPPERALPRDLWEWEVDVELADLSTEARLARVSLPLPTPGRHTWPSYQDVGEQLWREGWRGLLAPSAARPKLGQSLCLFWPSGKSLDGAEPHRPPRTIVEVPVPPVGMTT
jgi:RES domain-containing protein